MPRFAFLAPSWSWASVKYAVHSCFEVADPGKSGSIQMVKFVSSNLEMASDDPYGQVCGGYIELYGRLFPYSNDMYTPIYNSNLDFNHTFSPRLKRYVDSEAPSDTSEKNNKFILPIGYLRYPYMSRIREPIKFENMVWDFAGALLLQLCNTTPQKVYKRIGCVIIHRDGNIYGISGVKVPIDSMNYSQDEDLELIRII
jgi:hypothetical protein